MIYYILGLSFLWFLFRISKQIYRTYSCIDEKTIYDFWYGRLDKGSQKHRSVISHLGHCEKCRTALDEIRKGKPLEDHLIDN